MSNNMCSLENGGSNHSMSGVSSQSYGCSSLSKPFGSHLFGSLNAVESPLQSSLQTSVPLSSLSSLHPSGHTSGHTSTAFPFPPSPLFLSSLSSLSLNLLHHQSSQWFAHHNSLNTPLSLTTNDSKDILNNTTNSSNDNNNNNNKTINNKNDNKFQDSTQPLITQNNSLCEKSKSDSTSTTTDNTNSITSSNSSPNLSMNESERNTNRSHSDNLNWLAEVAISSRGLPSSPSGSAHLALPLSHHSSQRSLYDITSGQRLYSPRFGASNSPSYHFSYQTSNSPINSMTAINGVRAPPPSAHFSGPFMSNYSAYQQFSPTTAQNAISPFLVPNQSSVTNARNGTSYSTGIIDSYHSNAHNSHNTHNTHNAILSANSCSIASQSGLTLSNSRSPSLHSSDSSSMISSGPFSSPTISSESSETQTKSLVRSVKDSIHSPNDNNGRNEANDATVATLVSTGIKRKSQTSPELNNNDKNVYKLPHMWGKEGSRKHRILKPPNISIVEPNKSVAMHFESAPLSAPPIPCVRREEFLKRISDSDIVSYSNESIVEPNNCHNITSIPHQRRKSVPQTSSHKPLTTLAAKENSIQDTHYLSPNENSAPTEEHNHHNHNHNHLQYPIYFQKGSIIQLGNGKVKPVEEMSTQDFIESATRSPDLCADCSEVVKIEDKIKSCSVLLSFSVGRTKVPVTVEAPLEHPFFVFHKGWSSCSPEKSLIRYGLKCRKLKIGDICVSLTPKASTSCTTSTKSQQNIREESNDLSSNDKKTKSILSNHNMKANCAPLSLVKCCSETSNSLNDSELEKPNELLESKVEDSVPQVPTTASVNSSISSPTVESLKRNRRHSAPDAIESEPSKAS